jgi:hypothetical protein
MTFIFAIEELERRGDRLYCWSVVWIATQTALHEYLEEKLHGYRRTNGISHWFHRKKRPHTIIVDQTERIRIYDLIWTPTEEILELSTGDLIKEIMQKYMDHV